MTLVIKTAGSPAITAAIRITVDNYITLIICFLTHDAAMVLLTFQGGFEEKGRVLRDVLASCILSTCPVLGSVLPKAGPTP